jgi:iron complex outermembrane receptor protein
VRALRRFSFSLGVRDEFYASNNHQVSPTLAMGAWTSSRLKLRLSVSRAFRLPSFTDLYYHDPANVGSPNLRPESAMSYEAGFDWFLSRSARTELTIFQRRETDGIDYVRNSPTDIWRATNFQSLKFTGIESATRIRVRQRHLIDLNYTGLRGVQDASQGVFSKYSFNYPKHLGVGGWQAGLPKGLVARARLGIVKRIQRDPYAVFDFYFARAQGRLLPFFQVTNIMDTAYQEIFGVPMPGRAVMGGFEFVLRSESKNR